MEDDKVLTPQEIWQMQLEHQRKIEKELDKLTSPGPDWQEDLDQLNHERYRAFTHAGSHLEAFQIIDRAVCKFLDKYHTKKQNHD